MQQPAERSMYSRVLLKFSGEALMGQKELGIDNQILDYISDEVAAVYRLGVQVAVVVGGGNFFRGANIFKNGVNRITGDQMGMLATVINALALRDVFEKKNISCKIMSAVAMNGIVDSYSRNGAIDNLQHNHVVILAAGTGNPLVTTDSAMSLRGIELGADLLLKATNVDGVYTADPATNPNAQLYHRLTYQEALTQELKVLDLAAFCQCRDYAMKLRVFNMHRPGAFKGIILGEDIGTLVTL